MPFSDDENLTVATSSATVDEINRRFYERFPYPWSPATFEAPVDPDLERRVLNQNLGDFTHRRVPRHARIWVGGCGTNQALYTALRFPESDVVGSDLSAESLGICREQAKALGVSNLTLRRESLNDVTAKAEFDYVICTGVVHHNATPARVVERLRTALRPGGVLELMVYNRFHWTDHATLQKAIRMLAGDAEKPDFDREFDLARRLIGRLPVRSRLTDCLLDYGNSPDSRIADAVLQPVLHSYTVESFQAMARECGLEMLRPTPNVYEREHAAWELSFADHEVQAHYASLGDVERWQITNLLRFDTAPYIWFYFQRDDAPLPRQPEAAINARFLETRFTRTSTRLTVFRRDADGRYVAAGHTRPYPSAAPRGPEQSIYDAVDGQRTMREILQLVGQEPDVPQLAETRMRLTSSIYPFLDAVVEQSGSAPVVSAPAERRPDARERLRALRARGNTASTPTAPAPAVTGATGAATLDLLEWLDAHRTEVNEELCRKGFVVLERTGVRSPEDFERVALRVCTSLFHDNGEHPRETMGGSVYTPVLFAPEEKLLWHNENTFNDTCPSKILFCCVTPAERGGETPLADSRAVYRAIDPGIRARFEEKKVMYVRAYTRGLGRRWQEVFQTDDPAVVEAQSRAAGIACEWGDEAVPLRTRCVREAVITHPVTHERAWFTQAQHWHTSCLPTNAHAALSQLFPESCFPRQCYYGDGSPIEDSVMRHILDVYQQVEVSRPWATGDILIVDNLLTAHARNPYCGERKLLVAMGDMFRPGEIS